MRNRLMRRVGAFILCLLLCLGMASEALAYTGVSAWAQEEVDAADALGIIPATLQDKPLSGAMSRLDMCYMAVNTFEKFVGTELYPARIDHFSDTRDANVCVAYELGLVSGYPDGTFLPDKQITRQEFSKIVNNLLDALEWSEDAQRLAEFTDEGTVGEWAFAATARMVRLGVVTGGNGKLSPGGSTTVEQACAMFLRAYNVLTLDGDDGFVGAADPVEGDYTPSYIGISAWAQETVKQMDLMGLLPASIQDAVMNEPITRGQMCELAVLTYAALQEDLPEVSEQIFPDTELPAVSQASALGLVNGFPDGTFRPEELLTRQQFFVITNNLLEACGYQEEEDGALLQRVYADADSVSDWAKAPVALLYRLGVMHGNDQGCVTPGTGTTSEQAIAMLMRTYNQVSAWCEAHPLQEIVGALTVPDAALQAVELAKSFVGYPYVWAGASPSVGFDCSGLVYYVYQQLGYSLYRAGDGMAKNGIEVEESEMQPGDILIFANRSTGAIQHVGLYIGDGQMVHAQSSSTGVVISDYDYDSGKYIYTIRRIVY